MSSASIELVQGGYVAPLVNSTRVTPDNRGKFDSGVYYANRCVCERGRHLKNGFINIPAEISHRSAKRLGGTHLFGGVLYAHFGHFLVESISRIWAASHIASYESIVFIPRAQGMKIPRFIEDFFKLVGIETALTIVESTLKVERLWVPDQLVDPGSFMLVGHPFVRSLVGGLGRHREGFPKKVYVSRSKLPLPQGGIVFESKLEAMLEEQGYKIVNPESLSIADQLDLYFNAEDLVFAEGSAMHLYALVGNPNQKTFIVWRRAKARHIFDRQLRSFGLKSPFGSPCVIREYVQDEKRGAENRAFALLDFSELSSQLMSFGFINAPLHRITDVDVQAELRRIEEELGKMGRSVTFAA